MVPSNIECQGTINATTTTLSLERRRPGPNAIKLFVSENFHECITGLHDFTETLRIFSYFCKKRSKTPYKDRLQICLTCKYSMML